MILASISVRSRVWRVLRSMRLFVFLDGQVPGELSRTWDALKRPGESLLGYYANNELSLPEADLILVSTFGLHLLSSSDSPRTIDFESISDIDGPKEKAGADRLQLRLTNGSSEEVVVRGGRGKLRDVFGFLRFLRRVVQDRASS